MTYTVYILFSQKINRFYVGYSNDIKRRISEHNRIKGKYTDRGIPWKLVYTEEFDNKKDAMDRERHIKGQKSRSFIIHMIDNCQ